MGHEACCCSAHHAAFSSSPCTRSCWKLPRNLFLISHSFRSEAERIFYTQNHFVLLPTNTHVSFLQAQRNAPPCLDAFLAAIPAHCLLHLRSLEVVFPDVDHGFFAPGAPEALSPAFRWACGVDHLMSHCRTLALTPNLSSQCVYAAETMGMSALQRRDTEIRMLDVYCLVLKQLVARNLVAKTEILKGGKSQREQPLRDLFVYLSWPLALDERRERDRTEYETELERLVMGVGYDATARGK